MEKVKLEIVGMSYSQSQSGAYALILGVSGSRTRIPIMIGGFEAQAIAIAIEKIKPTRPLTHDLFKNFADHFDINISEVIINKFEEGIFYAQLVCEHNGNVSVIDSRTSDAVALAVRFNAPIYCAREVVDEVGIEMEEESGKGRESEESGFPSTQNDSGTAGQTSASGQTENPVIKYQSYLLEELEEMLQKAIEDENYEEASLLRDEIKRRKQEGT